MLLTISGYRVTLKVCWICKGTYHFSFYVWFNLDTFSLDTFSLFSDKSWLVLDNDANVRPGDSITYNINVESKSGDIYSETNTGKRDLIVLRDL